MLGNGPKTKVILIKRNFTRVLTNYDKILQMVTEYSEQSNLELYIHDDLNLPPLKVN